MKIGIITYHFARNYGAILQCYALQSYLTSIGHDAYVLNYETSQQERNNSLHHKRNNPIANLAVNVALLPFERQRREKERKFARFESEHLRLTPRLHTVEDLSLYVRDEHFQVLISGSDQVLNPYIADFDQAFLLPFGTDAVKASFAASLGSATAGELAPYEAALSDFDFLCVREPSDSVEIERLCGRSPLVADDPVFLLGASEWKTLAQSGGAAEGAGYVLGYYVNKERSSAYLALTETIARHLSLPVKVVNVRYGKDSFRPGMITDAGPADFLSLVDGASFVCTDSFHGTAFSLIFDKPFVSFEPSSDSHDWRKRNLLASVGEETRSIPIDLPDVGGAINALASVELSGIDVELRAIRDNQVEVLNAILAGE